MLLLLKLLLLLLLLLLHCSVALTAVVMTNAKVIQYIAIYEEIKKISTQYF